jgi:hypothetical protein
VLDSNWFEGHYIPVFMSTAEMLFEKTKEDAIYNDES